MSSDRIDDEVLGAYLKRRFFDTLGYYPKIAVRETLCDGIYDYRAVLDMAQLDDESLTYGCLRYVEHILDKWLWHLQNRPKIRFITYNASPKYSFAETPSWWQALEVNAPADYTADGSDED